MSLTSLRHLPTGEQMSITLRGRGSLVQAFGDQSDLTKVAEAADKLGDGILNRGRDDHILQTSELAYLKATDKLLGTRLPRTKESLEHAATQLQQLASFPAAEWGYPGMSRPDWATLERTPTPGQGVAVANYVGTPLEEPVRFLAQEQGGGSEGGPAQFLSREAMEAANGSPIFNQYYPAAVAEFQKVLAALGPATWTASSRLFNSTVATVGDARVDVRDEPTILRKDGTVYSGEPITADQYDGLLIKHARTVEIQTTPGAVIAVRRVGVPADRITDASKPWEQDLWRRGYAKRPEPQPVETYRADQQGRFSLPMGDVTVGRTDLRILHPDSLKPLLEMSID